eukprot:jgi/Orpsp1_1/1191357/evm.model.d7180000085145.1
MQPNKIIKNRNNVITTADNFTLFDRLYSETNDGSFAYMSNQNGLQLYKGSLMMVYSISLSKTNLSINNAKIVDDINKSVELVYNSDEDALILRDNFSNYPLWKYFGARDCPYLKSNDLMCNSIYSLNSLFNSKNNNNNWIGLFDNMLLFDDNTYTLNLTSVYNVKSSDPIYSIELTENGDLVSNDNKFVLHKEFFKKEDYYTLELFKPETYDKNILVMKSSRGEYKWSTGFIRNRPLYTNLLFSGDSFTEGEMLYCGTYSLILLEGKLIYRDHNTKEETVIEKKHANIKKLEIKDFGMSVFDIYNEPYIIVSAKNDEDFKYGYLTCDTRDKTVYYSDGKGGVKWSYPEKIYPIDYISPLAEQPDKTVWLYNEELKKCIHAPKNEKENIVLGECDDREYDQWIISYYGI